MVPFVGQLPALVAHRGGAHEAIENSLDAFASSVACGVPWSETDILLSADDVPMLLHDEHLQRTTVERGLASKLPSARLQQLPQKSDGFLPLDEPCIPTLAAALRVPGARYVLEVKAGSNPKRTIERAWDVVREAGAENSVVFASLEVDILVEVARIVPTVPRIAFIRDQQHLVQMLKHGDPTAVAVGPEWAVPARKLVPSGVALWVGLVNDDAQRRAAIQAGASTWLTDCPRACLEAKTAARPEQRKPFLPLPVA